MKTAMLVLFLGLVGGCDGAGGFGEAPGADAGSDAGGPTNIIGRCHQDPPACPSGQVVLEGPNECELGCGAVDER
jgi:hypothetical protein